MKFDDAKDTSAEASDNDGGHTKKRGLRFHHHFTTAGAHPFDAAHPFDTIRWERRSSVITNPDGSVVFRADDVEVPASWSQLATDIAVSKYFRKAGVNGGGETSARQLVSRVAKTIRQSGEEQGGYFASTEDADIFESELTHLLINQFGAFNSPVWFNVGLWHRYGITGAGQSYAWMEGEGEEGRVERIENSYERPQSSACFIQGVDDSLDSIMQLMTNEVMLFKYGSGTGTNFSALRGEKEKLSGGGYSSGLMSFLEMYDRAAGAIKSGGTCLAPYQRIYTASGPVPVKELADAKAPFVVLSFDPPTNRYKAKQARAWLAGRKNVVRVVTDKGQFDVTDDHPVRLATGEYVKAGELRSGTALFACSIDTRNGYTRVNLRDGKKGKEFFHRMVVHDVMGVDIDGLSVHHKDENKQNNAPTNLEVMHQREHAREHNIKQVGDGAHLFQREKFPSAGDKNGMHASSEFWNDAIKVDAYKQKQGEILAASGRATTMQSAAATQKMINTAYRIINAGYSIDTFDQYIEGRIKAIGPIEAKNNLRKMIDNRFGSYDKFRAEVAANNHRVVNVERIGMMDVYDVEVECPTADDKSPTTGHNFVIWPNDQHAGSGVVVANTRRAAKLVCLDMDHPDIAKFIQWKVKEERKAKALIAAGYPSDFNGEAYATVSGQNSNNSLRITNEFMDAALHDRQWTTKYRTTGLAAATFGARELWRMIAECAWECADPGVQFDTTINNWHTVPNSGRINASNPCSEYMHLDDSACNLASLNLTKFLKPDNTFDVHAFRYAVRVFFVAQEILVDLASYPTAPIAQNSHNFRPLGIGYANLGTLLMLQGLPYDSDEGRAMASAITAIMTGHAYRVSALMADQKGAFAGYAKNREPMLNVMRMHLEAADNLPPMQHGYLRDAAIEDWEVAVGLGKKHGYRNAQASVLAPTGTIGLLMDCDTTGVEPDFALVKFKKLAGGGCFKIVNGAVHAALRELGYSNDQIEAIVAYMAGTKNLDGTTKINRTALLECGLLPEELSNAECAMVGAFDLESCFAVHAIGKDAYARLGVDPTQPMLQALGFTADEVMAAADVMLGRHTIEGAPFLHPRHLPVFDCANRCGKYGVRFIEPMGHLRMMAAVQPFISGAISKTVNVPNETTVNEIAAIYESGWRLGLKAVALYRDGSKGSQPLSSGSKKGDLKTGAIDIEELAAQAAQLADASTTFDGGTDEPEHSQTATIPTPPPTIPLSPPTVHRLRLPPRRTGFTQEVVVGGHKVFVRTGEYADGKLGEIFIDMHKEGASFRALANCFAIAVSTGLQHGIPLDAFVDQFTFTRFEPQGNVQLDPHVKFATSIVDYIFRMLGVNYLHRYDLAHVQPEVEPTPPAYQVRAQDQRAASALDAAEIERNLGALAKVAERGKNALSAQLDEMMGDAPICDGCGHTTVRNGTCFRCMNCGNSMGCS
jgi:ribonucleoside-diphosphate reductase alpha chain